MNAIVKLIRESILQAFHQLTSNRLRSFLSLLGITIGILCVIGVKSGVDSLEDNLRSSFAKLGSDVLYIEKFPWTDSGDYKWWEYMRRPNPVISEYEVLEENLTTAELVAYFVPIGRKTLKYRSNSVEGAIGVATTREAEEIFNLEFEQGRYFSPTEYFFGSNKVILGATIAEELFKGASAVGKKAKFGGKSVEIIGVIKKSGKDLVKVMNFDEIVLMSIGFGKSMANLNSKHGWDSNLAVKAKDGVDIEELKDEVIGILRAKRRIKPKERNTFALNELTMLSEQFDQIFAVLNKVGLVIGIFALLVGMFSVANIMFVSVKERTNIIGVKKALGAKRSWILTEFLVESIILCLIGGGVGLLLIFGLVSGITYMFDFAMTLSSTNILLGLTVSVVVGILSGVIPAMQASKMDPVEAMRRG